MKVGKSMRRRRGLRSGLLISAGSASISIASFLRNIVIARIISVEDFGIAATLALTASLFELGSNLAVDRLLVQSRRGGSVRMQAAAHAILLLQGLIASVSLYLLAVPIASLFELGHEAWAFQLLAVLPLSRCFSHLDHVRYQRRSRFGATVTVEAGSQLLSLVAALPAGLYFQDFRAILAVVLIQGFSRLILSHIVAIRRYRWCFDRSLLSQAISFGWPLLLNGYLMFGIFHGDRSLVGIFFTLEELGLFSAAFALALAPMMMFARICNLFFLPILADNQNKPQAFANNAAIAVQATALAGMIIATGFVYAGPSVLTILYGEKYAAAATLVGLLGVMQGVRAMRQGPWLVALAKGFSRNALAANIARTLAFPVSISLVVYADAGLTTLIWCGIGGEIAAAAVSIYLMQNSTHTPFRFPLLGLLVMALAIGIGLIAEPYIISMPTFLGLGVGLGAAGLACGLTFVALADLRRWILRRFFG
jgi:O-antigen/teichoic acid export membrane protein